MALNYMTGTGIGQLQPQNHLLMMAGSKLETQPVIKIFLP
jgi:hypothetical protein